MIKDEVDKRVKRVQLTEMGKEQKAIAEEVPAQMLCKFNGMSTEESRTLKHLLDKLGGCFESSRFISPFVILLSSDYWRFLLIFSYSANKCAL